MPRKLVRSCDRCHRLKERCMWLDDSSSCVRCSRLGFPCSNTRPRRRIGRRPLSATSPQATTTTNTILPTVPASDDATSLIYNGISDYTIYSSFLVGPAFWKCHYQTLILHFERHKPMLIDAYLASVMSAARSRNQNGMEAAGGGISASYRHASSALKRLREMHVTDLDQASACLTLGSMVMLFAMFQRPQNTFTLARQTLILIKPVYETVQCPDRQEFFFLPGTIIFEMVGCLIYGLPPTVKYRPPVSEVFVDRYLGLCTFLLPLFFRLCELNSMHSTEDRGDDATVTQALNGLEAEVLAWQPTVPADICLHMSALEMAHVSCQTQAMRLAALLIIYRLRFPFGLNDLPARAMAMSVLTQLETTLSITGKAVKFAILPVLLGCVELKDHAEQEIWLARVPELVSCSKEYGLHIQCLIKSFWTVRDSGFSFKGYNIGRFLSPHDGSMNFWG